MKDIHSPFSPPWEEAAERRRRMLVVGVLYYGEGLPYGFLFKTLAYYLSSQGVTLTTIGLAGLLHLPWTLKFLWAPLVDRYGRRATWIAVSQLVIGGAMILLSLVPLQEWGYFLLLAVMALAGATQDIAIDGYTIDILKTEEQGQANGVRLTTYRLALIAAGGLVVWLSDYLDWSGAFLAMALSLLLVTAMVLFYSPAHQLRPEESAQTRQSLLGVARQAWVGILELPHLWAVVIFILMFKAGDAFLGQMVGPFWGLSGYTRKEYGLVSGTLGTVLSITGSLWGGQLCSRWGLKRSIWILGGLQAVSNLGYAVAALSPGTAVLTYGASMLESVTGGLGNAPFLTFMMRLCNRQVSAAQYAALSAIFSLSGTVASTLSGLTAERLGFASFFGLSFIVALPAFAVLPWVLPLVEKNDPQR